MVANSGSFACPANPFASPTIIPAGTGFSKQNL
jgi:hypothetical protein